MKFIRLVYMSALTAFVLIPCDANHANVSATTNIEPAPTNLSSFAFRRGFYDVVEMGWTDHSTDADSYHIERCLGATCTNFAEIAHTGGSATSYLDPVGWAKHQTFRYRVRAHGPIGYSGYSNIRTQTTPGL